MAWEDKTTVKKGDIGESIVDDYIRSKGYIPYLPKHDGAHPFDRLCASRDKKTIFIADVKAKAKRKFYPDTGIDERHYKDYLHIQNKYKIRVFLFFVDEEMGEIYGEFLDILILKREVKYKAMMINYPLLKNGIIYFPIKAMRNISKLDDEQIKLLKNKTTKKEQYMPQIP